MSEHEKQSCRICGCTWEMGCPEGYYWVEDDLCGSCYESDSSMIITFYDTSCHKCNVYYGSKFYRPENISKSQAIKYMRKHGWLITKYGVLCEECKGDKS